MMDEEKMTEEGKKVTKLRTAFREKAERIINENGEEYGFDK